MNPRLDVICFGILVADAIVRPVDEHPPRGALALVEEISLRAGGCAVNSAITLARLGLRAAVAGKVGADPFGDFLLARLDEEGVERGAVVRDLRVPTSATAVLVSSDGERTFLHDPGANAALRAEELDRESLFAGRALHLAGTLVMPKLDGEPAAAILAEARGRGLLTSVDTVWDATGRWERALPCLAHANLFCPSLAEGQALSGRSEPAAVADWLRARGVDEVALTMGADGCYVASDELEGRIEGIPVTSVDG
ncbi:MAG: carbohydrate kinase family protein, partial [Acidimicrobiia bacterium]